MLIAVLRSADSSPDSVPLPQAAITKAPATSAAPSRIVFLMRDIVSTSRVDSPSNTMYQLPLTMVTTQLVPGHHLAD